MIMHDSIPFHSLRRTNNYPLIQNIYHSNSSSSLLDTTLLKECDHRLPFFSNIPVTIQKHLKHTKSDDTGDPREQDYKV